MRIVVASPHRDDAAFSLGLAVTAWLAAGHRVEVLNCFTQSEYAPYSDVASLHGNDGRSFVSAVRRREDAAWNKLEGGRLRITDLDLLDAPLRLNCGVDEVLTVDVRPGDRAVARVAGALRKLAEKAQPGQIAFLLPLAVGEHIDHRVVFHAGLEILGETALPLAFYEDLPYTARPGLLDTVSGRVQATGMQLKPCYAQPASETPEVATRQKFRLASCYDSQIDNEVAAQIAGFCAVYDGRERMWGNLAWLASPLRVEHAEEGK